MLPIDRFHCPTAFDHIPAAEVPSVASGAVSTDKAAQPDFVTQSAPDGSFPETLGMAQPRHASLTVALVVALICSSLLFAPHVEGADPMSPTPTAMPGLAWDNLHRDVSLTDPYPEVWADGPQAGKTYARPLPLAELQALSCRLQGPPMYIVDNPEAYQTPGILGSTIAPTLGRGDGTCDFPGAGRLFVLANNRITAGGDRHWFTAVAHNPNDHEIELTVRGILFAPRVTTVSGDVPAAYLQGVFSGTHAVVSSSFLDFAVGKNGAFQRKIRVPARGTRILVESPHQRNTEIFALLDMVAPRKSDLFRLAVVASLQNLTDQDLQSIAAGRYPAAGKPEDYAYAGPTRYGRPNGVVTFGNTYVGGRTIELRPGTADGDLLFATRFRHVGTPTDLPPLEHVLPNPPAVPGPAATTDDGSYGMSYRLRYLLVNPRIEEARVTVALTSPRHPLDKDLKPLGGIMTLPIRFNDRRFNLRVDERGGGTVIGSYLVPPQASRAITIEFTHFGNTFPPAGIEFRTIQDKEGSDAATP
jgi:hypothetical protein